MLCIRYPLANKKHSLCTNICFVGLVSSLCVILAYTKQTEFEYDIKKGFMPAKIHRALPDSNLRLEAYNIEFAAALEQLYKKIIFEHSLLS